MNFGADIGPYLDNDGSNGSFEEQGVENADDNCDMDSGKVNDGDVTDTPTKEDGTDEDVTDPAEVNDEEDVEGVTDAATKEDDTDEDAEGDGRKGGKEKTEEHTEDGKLDVELDTKVDVDAAKVAETKEDNSEDFFEVNPVAAGDSANGSGLNDNDDASDLRLARSDLSLCISSVKVLKGNRVGTASFLRNLFSALGLTRGLKSSGTKWSIHMWECFFGFQRVLYAPSRFSAFLQLMHSFGSFGNL